MQAADPIASRQSTKRSSAQTLSAKTEETEANASGTTLKKGVDKTGVSLCYHKDNEFRALTKAQKAELIAWRNTPEGKTSVANEKAACAAKKQN